MRLSVKVIPRARKSDFAGLLADGTQKIKLAAVPEDGKANAELCRFLAERYKVPATKVSIVSGHTSTRKVVQIEDII